MVMKIIRRYLIPFFKGFVRFLGRIVRPVIGMFIFAILAVMEVSDWTGLMSKYSDPGKEAIKLGITTQESRTLLLIMIFFATGIVLASLITIVGLFQEERWIIRTSQLTGIFFVLYGVFQIYSAITLITIGQETRVLAGIVYIIIGLAVFGLGGSFVTPSNPSKGKPFTKK
jgi:hypothetical protein